VVSLAGVCDLEHMAQVPRPDNPVADFLGGVPAAVPDRCAAASPIRLVPLGVPQVLVHGDADDRVPREISLRYGAAARAAGDVVELVELPGVDHFALIDPASRAWKAAAGALLRHLPP
jgi:dipeptidyl aminopeptidase/acylaminoacyl peptidase